MNARLEAVASDVAEIDIYRDAGRVTEAIVDEAALPEPARQALRDAEEQFRKATKTDDGKIINPTMGASGWWDKRTEGARHEGFYAETAREAEELGVPGADEIDELIGLDEIGSDDDAVADQRSGVDRPIAGIDWCSNKQVRRAFLAEKHSRKATNKMKR